MKEPGKDTLLWKLGVIIVFLSFIALGQRAQMTRMGYDIQQLQQQKKRLTKSHKELLIEVESLSALDRIEEIAVQRLSMMPASPTQHIYIRQEKQPVRPRPQ